MAIPVSHVAETIVAFATQMKQALCDAKAAGIVLELEENFKFRLSVISPNGLGALSRTTTQNTGEQVQIVENPDRVETQLVGEGLTTTTAGETTSTSTQTQVSPEKTTERTEDAVTETTTRSAAPSVTETAQNQETTQQSVRNAGGGNTTREDTTYESL